MDRMIQANVIAMSGRAVEAAGDVDVLLLDKTGTITLGNRQATQFLTAHGVTEEQLADAAQLSSLADETPEGRSIVVLAKEKYGIREREVGELGATFVPFTAQTRMSGVDLNGREIRKGSVDAIEEYVKQGEGYFSPEVRATVDEVSRAGGTPLVVSEKTNGQAPRVLGVVQLKDIVKGGMVERFSELRRIGIKTVMITGDNPPDRCRDCRRSRSRRFSGAGDARSETETDSRNAGRWPPGRDDRRRHQRRGPRWRRLTLQSAMNSGTQAAKEGRQHGRSGFQPDQAD